MDFCNKKSKKVAFLDPTLKGGDFGRQDKIIRRFKRITKKEMNRLEVLADSPTAVSAPLSAGVDGRKNSSSLSADKIRRSCRGNSSGYDDWNRNSNGNEIINH